MKGISKMKSNSNDIPFTKMLQGCILCPINIVQKQDNSYTYDEIRVPATDDNIKNYINVVQAVMDFVAQEKGYDNIFTACTYATSTSERFAAEGQACVTYRDQVWTTCYGILAQVQAGTLPAPTIDALVAALPVMVWPSD